MAGAAAFSDYLPAHPRNGNDRLLLAACVIYCALRTWQGWEDGSREMHPALWELWLHKTGIQPAEVALDAITPS